MALSRVIVYLNFLCVSFMDPRENCIISRIVLYQESCYIEDRFMSSIDWTN